MFEQHIHDTPAQSREGDFVNSDGLLYCGQCRQAKECYIKHPSDSTKRIKKCIPCQCKLEEEECYRRRKYQQDFQDRVAELRRQGITDEAYTHQRFENDDRRNPAVTDKCLKYVEKWVHMKENCYGITFNGAVGGGKSFYACCIANALIDRGVSVLVTRLSDLVRNRVQDKTPVVNLREFELVVLDDIGVEGATQTAYNIVDDIYRANIPLIVTTNLSLSQMAKGQTVDKQRIFDRIMQRACYPIKVDVTISRFETARKNAREAQAILNSD